VKLERSHIRSGRSLTTFSLNSGSHTQFVWRSFITTTKVERSVVARTGFCRKRQREEWLTWSIGTLLGGEFNERGIEALDGEFCERGEGEGVLVVWTVVRRVGALGPWYGGQACPGSHTTHHVLAPPWYGLYNGFCFGPALIDTGVLAAET